MNNRNNFCLCGNCQRIYRLSDSVIYQDLRPKLDWLEKLEADLKKLEQKEREIKSKLAAAKLEATIQGRKEAAEHIANYDTLFSPLGLNPNDAKTCFDPVDYIVFNGMNDFTDPTIKNIVLLDRKDEGSNIQQSIRETIENERYNFLTIKIQADGTVIEE